MLNHHHSLKMQGNAYDMTGGEQHYEFMSTFLDAYGNELAPHSGDPVHQGSGHQNNMTGAYNLSQNGHHFGGSNGSYDNFIPQQYHGQYGNSHGMMGDYHQQLYGGSGSSGGPGNSQTSGTSSSGSGNSSGSSSSGSGNAASSNPYGVGGYNYGSGNMMGNFYSANSMYDMNPSQLWSGANSQGSSSAGRSSNSSSSLYGSNYMQSHGSSYSHYQPHAAPHVPHLNAHNLTNSHLLTHSNMNIKVGVYTRAERVERIQRFRQRKQSRIWKRQIKYDCRKRLADTRPRVKGRFVSSSDDMEVLTAVIRNDTTGNNSASNNPGSTTIIGASSVQPLPPAVVPGSGNGLGVIASAIAMAYAPILSGSKEHAKSAFASSPSFGISSGASSSEGQALVINDDSSDDKTDHEAAEGSNSSLDNVAEGSAPSNSWSNDGRDGKEFLGALASVVRDGEGRSDSALREKVIVLPMPGTASPIVEQLAGTANPVTPTKQQTSITPLSVSLSASLASAESKPSHDAFAGNSLRTKDGMTTEQFLFALTNPLSPPLNKTSSSSSDAAPVDDS
jgi:hypothetical protein